MIGMSISNDDPFERKAVFVQHDFYPPGNPLVNACIDQDGIALVVCNDTNIDEASDTENIAS